MALLILFFYTYHTFFYHTNFTAVLLSIVGGFSCLLEMALIFVFNTNSSTDLFSPLYRPALAYFIQEYH